MFAPILQAKGKKLENIAIGNDAHNLAHFATEGDLVSSGLSAFLAKPEPEKRSPNVFKYLDLASAQLADHACSSAIQALESHCPSAWFKKSMSSSDCDFAQSLARNESKLHLDPGSRLLTLKNNGKFQLVVPPSKIAEFLRAAHSAHLGIFSRPTRGGCLQPQYWLT